jgi:RAP1 GTPase activating protein 1
VCLIQGQFTEEQILDNNENSPMFEEFLQLLGDKVRLRGFDKYKGGLGKNKSLEKRKENEN